MFSRATRVFIFSICLLLTSHVASAGSSTTMTWSDCVAEAAKNNPDLAGSSEAVSQSKAEQWISASPTLPQISATASLGRSDDFSGNAPRDENQYKVRGEQLIFDGFKTFSKIKSSKQGVKASQYGYTVTSASVRYELRSAFVGLLRAQSLVPITKGIIERRKQNLSMIRLKYESGREHEGSLLLAEADLAQAQYDLKRAERDISIAQYALNKALGRDERIPVRVTGDFRVGSDSKGGPDLASIADAHPAVDKARSESRAAQYNLDSAKAAFSPVVKLSAEAGKIKPISLSSQEHGWSAGIDFTLPIFNGGENIASLKKSRAAYMQSQFESQSKYESVLSDLEKSWQEFQDSIENVGVQEKYLKASEVRAKISRAEYANGLQIFDNWIIIEDNYIKAQKSYVNAQAEMLIAEAAWVMARGGDLGYEQ